MKNVYTFTKTERPGKVCLHPKPSTRQKTESWMGTNKPTKCNWGHEVISDGMAEIFLPLEKRSECFLSKTPIGS